MSHYSMGMDRTPEQREESAAWDQYTIAQLQAENARLRAARGPALYDQDDMERALKSAAEPESWCARYIALWEYIIKRFGKDVFFAEDFDLAISYLDDAMMQSFGQWQAENARLRALLKEAGEVIEGGKRAVNAAYQQAHAEYHRHDKIALKHDDVVGAWKGRAAAFMEKLGGEPTIDLT